MNVTVIGAGYVGLATGVTFAYLGDQVTCLDVDAERIEGLRAGRVPIYEPHLSDLLAETAGRLRFTTRYDEAVPGADVIFIAVGTPAGPDGAPDLRALIAAANSIGAHLGDGFRVVVTKSTVPIGSGNQVDALIRDAYEQRHGRPLDGRCVVASNPEFLREGSALHDMFYPDRIVIGADDARALAPLTALYRPVVEQSFRPPVCLPRPAGRDAVPLLSTGMASAELIKYAANTFLMLKVSFINEIAALSERAGADIDDVARGIGLDTRIGTGFLRAGIGWGGSCFPKDTAALIAMAAEHGLAMPITEAARGVNLRQRQVVVDKLLAELKTLRGRTIGLLGLAFKPHTDDVRDAPSIDIARRLLDGGARVAVHDIAAMPLMETLHPELALRYCEHPEVVALNADALILVTEWPHYRDLPWESIARSMRTPLIVDGRNALDRVRLAQAGFRYIGIGR